MSEFFKWTKEEYGLDIFEMDDEHKILIDKMNVLFEAHKNSAGFPDLQQKVDDLAEYTVKHFADEEEYMGKIDFPGLTTHKIIHQQLLKQFGDHVEKFKQTKTLDDGFFNFLKVWLSAHIRGIDMKYSDFSKQEIKAS